MAAREVELLDLCVDRAQSVRYRTHDTPLYMPTKICVGINRDIAGVSQEVLPGPEMTRKNVRRG